MSLSAPSRETGTQSQTNENENEDQQQQNENYVEAENEEVEDMTAQSTIDKYSNELTDALSSSDVAGVRRLCINEAVRNYTPYHLTQLEQVLSGSSLTGDAQLQCWHALSQAWPASVESNLGSLIREAVTGGPLEALQELIQKRKERSVRQLTNNQSIKTSTQLDGNRESQNKSQQKKTTETYCYVIVTPNEN